MWPKVSRHTKCVETLAETRNTITTYNINFYKVQWEIFHIHLITDAHFGASLRIFNVILKLHLSEFWCIKHPDILTGCRWTCIFHNKWSSQTKAALNRTPSTFSLFIQCNGGDFSLTLAKCCIYLWSLLFFTHNCFPTKIFPSPRL